MSILEIRNNCSVEQQQLVFLDFWPLAVHEGSFKCDFWWGFKFTEDFHGDHHETKLKVFCWNRRRPEEDGSRIDPGKSQKTFKKVQKFLKKVLGQKESERIWLESGLELQESGLKCRESGLKCRESGLKCYCSKKCCWWRSSQIK